MLHSSFSCLSGQLGTQNAMTRCRCILMLFFFSLSSWTHSMRCCTFKILWKKRTSMWRRCYLPQNWNQAVHTERVFIAFSRGTSITVALASQTRKPKANFSQVYSLSVNVRKPWKYFHFAVSSAWSSALRFSAKLHLLGSECPPPLACAPILPNTEGNEIGAQWLTKVYILLKYL